MMKMNVLVMLMEFLEWVEEEEREKKNEVLGKEVMGKNERALSL